MKILKINVLNGPNFWSTYRKQLIVMKLDLEEMEEFPTNKIDGFPERLKELIPTLYSHRCSVKKPGGFFERIKKGTWLGHVIEHIALELQSLAGMPCGFGRTRSTYVKGVYNVVFTYTVEEAGYYVAQASVRLVEALCNNENYDVQKDIDALSEINRSYGIGPTTQSIINAAKRNKIPYKRLNNSSLILLGYGANQQIFEASTAGTTSSIGVELASDKSETKKILSENYIPTPQGELVKNEEELKIAIGSLGYPLVIKPFDGNQGRGITTNINNEENAIIAFYKAFKISTEVIVEKYIKGLDYRILVINYKVAAVSRRTPALVIGDGKLSVLELIEKTNKDPDRGKGHEKILTQIKINDELENFLKLKGFNLGSILPSGEILFLNDTANLSTGGTARDATDVIHPLNVFLAERVSRLMNLNICGIDLIAQDISQPITKENGAILEVNSSPGFRMHLSPSKGIPRNVGENVIKMLYPEGSESRIPIIAVTGTNGKTTTTRLISHLAKSVGYKVGFTTTDGIYIDGKLIHSGDCSGPSSAQVVLRDPLVDFAVLECARGGILRSGLGFDKCNISIITNITEDHLGLNDINSLEDMAKVKSVVTRSTFDDGFAILNADDDVVYSIRKELDCNIALFSTQENNPRIISHCENGGWAAIIEKGYFTICQGEWRVRIAKVKEVPLTLNGTASCMIKNVLPSILAATLSKIDSKNIRNALQGFVPSPELTPGRMNIFKVKDFKVMIDYVHNTDGFKELREFMSHVSATQKVGIIGCTGDRRDQDIKFMAAVCAQIFDKIIIRHDKDGRGRTNEEITALIIQGIQSEKSLTNFEIISDEHEALQYAIDNAIKGSFIVVSSDDIEGSTNLIKSIKETNGEKIFQRI